MRSIRRLAVTAGVGAGAAVLVSVALGGAALSVRPRRVSANA